jgi:hypothetical protein
VVGPYFIDFFLTIWLVDVLVPASMMVGEERCFRAMLAMLLYSHIPPSSRLGGNIQSPERPKWKEWVHTKHQEVPPREVYIGFMVIYLQLYL